VYIFRLNSLDLCINSLNYIDKYIIFFLFLKKEKRRRSIEYLRIIFFFKKSKLYLTKLTSLN
jgi:hypothetical protein